jgi:TonB family protein
MSLDPRAAFLMLATGALAACSGPSGGTTIGTARDGGSDAAGSLGTVETEGLSKASIGKVIKQHWNEVKSCFERELNKDPKCLHGTIVLKFAINEAGKVSQASVSETTMNNRKVEDCIVQRALQWTFPAPTGGRAVQVTYPWTFNQLSPEPDECRDR